MMLFADVLLIALSLLLSYSIRFDFNVPAVYLSQYLSMLPFVLPIKVGVFFLLGLYRGMWRYTSLSDFWLLIHAVILQQLIIIGIIAYVYHFEGYPRSIFLLDGILTLLLCGMLRISIRSYFQAQKGTKGIKRFLPVKKKAHNSGNTTVIVGAGNAGEKVARELLENKNADPWLLGFVDDDLDKQNRCIHGLPVLGSLDSLPDIIEKYNVQEVLIAMPSASGEQMRRIITLCENSEVNFKTLPSLGDLINGKVSLKKLRDVRYQDLLGRPPVSLETEQIHGYIQGKTVLVSGCGGSIGSELCRQLLPFKPGKLLLLDSSEVNLYAIQMELEHERKFTRFETFLGQVQDSELMDWLFARQRPDVIFHAAAYKHVPMLEENPWQAVYNNILGTKTILEAAVKYEVDRFVLVSTDKAVRPTNVMGATKRVTELLLQSMPQGRTKLMAVRFGNVVGSSGSVIPLFRRQIELGGPVTVTHPEVTRYFMTISEAAQLILQAGAMGEEREIFVLQMGTPVRIADMARDLIRLSGKEPDVDVSIAFTGLRPGEKLYEELITEDEGVVPTEHEKVLVLRAENNQKDQLSRKHESLKEKLQELIQLSREQDEAGIKKILHNIVPEYANGN
jgi:FlaA1/EpsC-like NDP-sugar epimerase